MLDDMLEGIRTAIYDDDYEMAQELARDACSYAERNGIKSELLLDLTIVAYGPEIRDCVASALNQIDAMAAMQLYADFERAAKDLGLPQHKIIEILGETLH